MKKSIIVSALLLFSTVLTGCMHKDLPTADQALQDWKSSLIENLYGDFDMTALDALNNYISKSTFDLNVGDLSQMLPGGPSSASFSQMTESKINASDPENLKSESHITLNAAAQMPAPMEGMEAMDMSMNFDGMLTIADQSMFFRIDTLDVVTPMMPMQLALKPEIMQQWFGASFEEFNTLLSEMDPTGAEVDLQESMQSGLKIQQIVSDFRNVLEGLTLFTPTSELKEEDDFYVFDVEATGETLASDAQSLMTFLQTLNPTTAEEDLNTIIEGIKASVSKIEGQMRISKEESGHFSFQGTVLAADGNALSSLEMSVLEDEMFVLITPKMPEAPEVMISWMEDEDTESNLFAFEVGGMSLVQAQINEKTTHIDLYDLETQAKLVVFDLMEGDDEGQIGKMNIVPMGVQIDMNIEEFEMSTEEFEMDIKGVVSMGGEELGDFAMTSEVEMGEVTEITAPTDAEPLEVFTTAIEELMGSLMMGGMPAGEDEFASEYDDGVFQGEDTDGMSDEAMMDEAAARAMIEMMLEDPELDDETRAMLQDMLDQADAMEAETDVEDTEAEENEATDTEEETTSGPKPAGQ